MYKGFASPYMVHSCLEVKKKKKSSGNSCSVVSMLSAIYFVIVLRGTISEKGA